MAPHGRRGRAHASARSRLPQGVSFRDVTLPPFSSPLERGFSSPQLKGTRPPRPGRPSCGHTTPPARFWRERGRLGPRKPVAGRVPGRARRAARRPRNAPRRTAVALAPGTEPGCRRPGFAPHVLGAARGNPASAPLPRSHPTPPRARAPPQALPPPPELPSRRRRNALPTMTCEALPVTSRPSCCEAQGTSGDVTRSPEMQRSRPGTPRLASYRFTNSLNVAKRMPSVLQKTARTA